MRYSSPVAMVIGNVEWTKYQLVSLILAMTAVMHGNFFL